MLLLFLLLVVDALVAAVVAVANGHEAAEDGDALTVVMPTNEFGNKTCRNINKNISIINNELNSVTNLASYLCLEKRTYICKKYHEVTLTNKKRHLKTTTRNNSRGE